MAVRNGIRLWQLVLAVALTVGSVSYTVGVKTSRACPDPALEKRVKKCEVMLARWDERWVFIRDKIVSIDMKLDKLNGRFASD